MAIAPATMAARRRKSLRLERAGHGLRAFRGPHQPVPSGLEGPGEVALGPVRPDDVDRGHRRPVAEAEARHQQIVRLVPAAGLDLADLEAAVRGADLHPRA